MNAAVLVVALLLQLLITITSLLQQPADAAAVTDNMNGKGPVYTIENNDQPNDILSIVGTMAGASQPGTCVLTIQNCNYYSIILEASMVLGDNCSLVVGPNVRAKEFSISATLSNGTNIHITRCNFASDHNRFALQIENQNHWWNSLIIEDSTFSRVPGVVTGPLGKDEVCGGARWGATTSTLCIAPPRCGVTPAAASCLVNPSAHPPATTAAAISNPPTIRSGFIPSNQQRLMLFQRLQISVPQRDGLEMSSAIAFGVVTSFTNAVCPCLNVTISDCTLELRSAGAIKRIVGPQAQNLSRSSLLDFQLTRWIPPLLRVFRNRMICDAGVDDAVANAIHMVTQVAPFENYQPLRGMRWTVTDNYAEVTGFAYVNFFALELSLMPYSAVQLDTLEFSRNTIRLVSQQHTSVVSAGVPSFFETGDVMFEDNDVRLSASAATAVCRGFNVVVNKSRSALFRNNKFVVEATATASTAGFVMINPWWRSSGDKSAGGVVVTITGNTAAVRMYNISWLIVMIHLSHGIADGNTLTIADNTMTGIASCLALALVMHDADRDMNFVGDVVVSRNTISMHRTKASDWSGGFDVSRRVDWTLFGSLDGSFGGDVRFTDNVFDLSVSTLGLAYDPTLPASNLLMLRVAWYVPMTIINGSFIVSGNSLSVSGTLLSDFSVVRATIREAANGDRSLTVRGPEFVISNNKIQNSAMGCVSTSNSVCVIDQPGQPLDPSLDRLRHGGDAGLFAVSPSGVFFFGSKFDISFNTFVLSQLTWQVTTLHFINTRALHFNKLLEATTNSGGGVSITVNNNYISAQLAPGRTYSSLSAAALSRYGNGQLQLGTVRYFSIWLYDMPWFGAAVTRFTMNNNVVLLSSASVGGSNSFSVRLLAAGDKAVGFASPSLEFRYDNNTLECYGCLITEAISRGRFSTSHWSASKNKLVVVTPTQFECDNSGDGVKVGGCGEASARFLILDELHLNYGNVGPLIAENTLRWSGEMTRGGMEAMHLGSRTRERAGQGEHVGGNISSSLIVRHNVAYGPFEIMLSLRPVLFPNAKLYFHSNTLVSPGQNFQTVLLRNILLRVLPAGAKIYSGSAIDVRNNKFYSQVKSSIVPDTGYSSCLVILGEEGISFPVLLDPSSSRSINSNYFEVIITNNEMYSRGVQIPSAFFVAIRSWFNVERGMIMSVSITGNTGFLQAAQVSVVTSQPILNLSHSMAGVSQPVLSPGVQQPPPPRFLMQDNLFYVIPTSVGASSVSIFSSPAADPVEVVNNTVMLVAQPPAAMLAKSLALLALAVDDAAQQQTQLLPSSFNAQNSLGVVGMVCTACSVVLGLGRSGAIDPGCRVLPTIREQYTLLFNTISTEFPKHRATLLLSPTSPVTPPTDYRVVKAFDNAVRAPRASWRKPLGSGDAKMVPLLNSHINAMVLGRIPILTPGYSEFPY